MAAAAGLHHTELVRLHPVGRSPTVLNRAERQTRGAADLHGWPVVATVTEAAPEMVIRRGCGP